MVRVIESTDEELRLSLADLLERLGRSRSEADQAQAAGLLTGEDYWTYEKIRSIDFLLGDETDD